ncbi:MAG TPA: Gfo/Idh/MocA family oxidoreductase [Lacunisphaera sp.]|nr:Gfo/Idh/MocA family oxidoreductase [Lacunisphaera sp.]
MNAAPLNVLIIGTGMYVCGRGTDGYGTILPAVLQARRRGAVGEIHVAGRTAENFVEFGRRARELARTLGVDGHYVAYPKHGVGENSYQAALAALPDPGAVLICTPDAQHTRMAIDTARAGRPFLVVKPLTPTYDEALQVLAATEKAGVHGVVEFHKRWDWANLQLYQRLRQGEIGQPLYFKVEYSQRKSIPTQVFRNWVDQTNIFQYLAVHYVDLIHFMTGATPLRASAVGQKVVLPTHGIDNYDAIQATVEWSAGFTSVFLVNWVDPESSPAMSQQKIEVVGSLGRIDSDQVNRGTEVWTSKGITQVNPQFCQLYQPPGEPQPSYRGYGIDSVDSFLEDARRLGAGETTVADLAGRRPTIRSALASSSVIEAVNKSLAARGAWKDCR